MSTGRSSNRSDGPTADSVLAVVEYDSRFKRLNAAPDVVLINNFKCGYSSSNRLPYRIVNEIRDHDTVVFFYRDVILRAVSAFIHWCITDERHATERDWLLHNLRRHLDDESYGELLQLFARGRHTDAFRVYADSLPSIAGWNNHTLPQVEILEYFGVERLDHFVELERPGYFARLTGTAFPWEDSNRSDAGIKRSIIRLLVEDDKLRADIEHVYAEDLEFFAANGLSTIDWRR